VPCTTFEKAKKQAEKLLSEYRGNQPVREHLLAIRKQRQDCISLESS
jgi:hypothetical protein